MKKTINILSYIVLVIIFYVILYYLVLGISSFFPHNKIFNGIYFIFLFILNPILSYKISELIIKKIKMKLNYKTIN